MNSLRSQIVSALCGVAVGFAGHVLTPPAGHRGDAKGQLSRDGTSENAGTHFADSLNQILAVRESNGRLTGADYSRMSDIIRAWLKSDLAGCLNYLKEKGCLGLVTDSMMAEALSEASGDSLVRAVAISQQVLGGDIRELILRMAFGSDNSATLDEALSTLNHLPKPLITELWKEIVGGLVKRGGRGAVENVLKWEGYPQTLLGGTVAAYASIDLDGAIELIYSSPDIYGWDGKGSLSRYTALQMVFLGDGGKARLPLETSLDCLMKLPAGQERNGVLSDIAAFCLREDPDKFQHIVPNLPHAEGEHVQTSALAFAAAWLDISKSLPMIDLVEDPEQRSLLLRVAGTGASSKEAADRIEGLALLTDPGDREVYSKGLMSGWITRAPTAAFEFAAQQIQKGGESVLLNVIPEVLGDVLNKKQPLYFGRETDFSAMKSLDPRTKETLREFLQARMPAGDFEKLGAYLNHQ